MYVISTSRMLVNLPDDLQATDTVIVFFKESDTMKVMDVAVLAKKQLQLEFIETADRDDMLICLGGVLGKIMRGEDTKCIFLDSAIPVPKRYEDRISVYGKKTTRGRRRKVEVPVQDDESNESESDSDSA